MENIQPVQVDLSGHSPHARITAKQGDRESRYIECVITNNQILEQIGADTKAFFALRKPDNTHVANDATISGGRVICELSPQCLAVPGICNCEITLYKGKSILTTATFQIDVKRNVFDEHLVISSNEYNIFLRTIEEIQAYCDQKEAEREAGERYRENEERKRQRNERTRIFNEQMREEQEARRQELSAEATKRAEQAADEAEKQGDYAKAQGDYAKDALSPALAELTALNACDGENPFQRVETIIRIDGGTPYTRGEPQHRVFDGGTPETRAFGR